jgi:hypothetical protein
MTTVREAILVTEDGDAGPQNDLIPQQWDTVVTCVTTHIPNWSRRT